MTGQTEVQMLIAGQESLEWFNTHIVAIRRQYNNKFVALEDKQIIDFDSNLDTLMERLLMKKIDLSSVMVEFISEIKKVL